MDNSKYLKGQCLELKNLSGPTKENKNEKKVIKIDG
jgi:hypothetical protein